MRTLRWTANTIRVALGLAAFTALATAAFLVTAAVAPAVLGGWVPSVLTSGSMRPVLDPGDVVVTEPVDTAPGVGSVITFDDPARDGRVTHRIVGETTGGIVTKGDANPGPDSTPVAPEQVVGRGRLALPFIGIPAAWVASRAWGPLAALGAGVLVALLLARDALRRLALVGQIPPRGHRPGWRHWRSPGAPPRRWAMRFAGMASLMAMGLTAFTAVSRQPSAAAFSVATANGASTFSSESGAGCPSPGTQTLVAVADADVQQDKADLPLGTASDLTVNSNTGSVSRIVARFALPSITSWCQVTSATLSFDTSTSKQGFTYLAYRAGQTWDEATVTWNNQPAVTGPAAPAPTVATNERIQFDVTTHVQAMYSASTNHGFVVRDQVENTGATNKNVYKSREHGKGREPHLVVMFG